jgi:hypothetical protein
LNIILEGFDQVCQFREQSGILLQIIGEWNLWLSLHGTLRKAGQRQKEKQSSRHAIDQVTSGPGTIDPGTIDPATTAPRSRLLHPVTSRLNFGLTRGPVSIGWRSNLSLVSDKLTLPNTNGQQKRCQEVPGERLEAKS